MVRYRKGNLTTCERPENLLNIASSVVSRMNRKIGEPLRKGAPAFATGNSGKIMNDVKGLINNPTVSTKLQKIFGTKDQRNQAILKEHSDKQAKIDRQNKVDQIRNGSRKGYTTVDGKSPMEVLKMLEYMQGFPDQRNIIASGNEDTAEEYLKNDADFNGITYEENVRDIIEQYEEFMEEDGL